MMINELSTPVKTQLTAAYFLIASYLRVKKSRITRLGRNTEIVDTTAPRTPDILYPMKVAAMTIGPGVICPRLYRQ